jgi:2-polyprenyl-3-methyl-5-hydroxy-6-metoxy-1,4-benzoquinol methylase
MSVKNGTTSPTSSDVLLANQLYYAVEAGEYDHKNHVKNPAIVRYYEHLFDRFVFEGRPTPEVKRWRACDVGCGTGFLESMLQQRVRSIVAFDATRGMLMEAKKKFVGAPISWVQSDAQALPVREPVFDLVCSNAMLHHVFGFQKVLADMISLLKPGGKLFLGYEPNAIPYRTLWPLLKIAARIVPEHRNRARIREASGQDRHSNLKNVDIHELSEFHIFQSRGIAPFELQRFVEKQGIVQSRVHFSSVYQFALLRDSGFPLPLTVIPDWLYRLSGRMSLSFSMTGTKA